MQQMVSEAIRLKANGLSNGNIICAPGIHESTFYRRIGNLKTSCSACKARDQNRERPIGHCSPRSTRRRSTRNQCWSVAWLLERKHSDDFDQAVRKGDNAKADTALVIEKLRFVDRQAYFFRPTRLWRN